VPELVSLPSRAANEWKTELFVENVLNIVILFGDCNDFCPTRTSDKDYFSTVT